MSPYEVRCWRELGLHSAKKAKRRQLMPPNVHAALATAGARAKDVAVHTGAAIAESAPESVREFR